MVLERSVHLLGARRGRDYGYERHEFDQAKAQRVSRRNLFELFLMFMAGGLLAMLFFILGSVLS